MFAECGTVWCELGGVSLQQVALWCVWDSLLWVWRCECELCVGDFVWVWGVRVCCVWDSFAWNWGSECMLCLGQIVMDLGKGVCVIFGIVWCGFG